VTKKQKPEEEPHVPLPEGLRPEDMVTPEDVELDSGTLSGDIRDLLLMNMRDMKVPWAMLSEQEQGDKIYAVSQAGERVVRLCLQALAKRKLPAVHVTVGAYKVDKNLEIKLGAAPTVANITLMAEHGHGGALLVLAEAADYFGERAPAKPDKDQPDLPIKGEPVDDD
jgi:hypothetical protein